MQLVIISVDEYFIIYLINRVKQSLCTSFAPRKSSNQVVCITVQGWVRTQEKRLTLEIKFNKNGSLLVTKSNNINSKRLQPGASKYLQTAKSQVIKETSGIGTGDAMCTRGRTMTVFQRERGTRGRIYEWVDEAIGGIWVDGAGEKEEGNQGKDRRRGMRLTRRYNIHYNGFVTNTQAMQYTARGLWKHCKPHSSV